MKSFSRKPLLPVLGALSLVFVAGAVRADQDVQSSDGQWKVHAKVASSLPVKKSSEAIINISPAGSAKGCPTVSGVVFEMPSHGHGGSVEPQSMAMGTCEWHVTDVNPSMAGDWRLRLVLKSGATTSNADISLPAK